MTTLIGTPKDILESATNHVKARSPLLFYGPPGVGKTSTAKLIANNLHYKLIMINASDARDDEQLKSLHNKVCNRSFIPLLFLLDEADGLRNWKLVEKILINTKHPIILTANDIYKIPQSVQKKCERIQFKHPKLEDIAKLLQQEAKATGVKLIPGVIHGDVRSSMMMALYGGEINQQKSDFDDVKKILKGVELDEYDEDQLIWILENTLSFHKGRDLYMTIQLLTIAQRTGHPEMLKFIPSGQGDRVNYPSYLTKLKERKKDVGN